MPGSGTALTMCCPPTGVMESQAVEPEIVVLGRAVEEVVDAVENRGAWNRRVLPAVVNGSKDLLDRRIEAADTPRDVEGEVED